MYLIAILLFLSVLLGLGMMLGATVSFILSPSLAALIFIGTIAVIIFLLINFLNS